MIDCEHHADRSGYRRVYEISGREPVGMKVFEFFRYGYGEGTRSERLDKAPLGELALKIEDAVGLDRLLEFYRLRVAGDSTTSDSIRIEYRSNGKIVGTEEFIDQPGVVNMAEDYLSEGDDFLRENSRGCGHGVNEGVGTTAPLQQISLEERGEPHGGTSLAKLRWFIVTLGYNMKTIAYFTGVALFGAGIVALILGASDFQASVLLCIGALVGAASGNWITESKKRMAAGLGLILVFSAYLLVTTLCATESHEAFSLFRNAWFGLPFASIVAAVAILQTRKAHAKKAQPAPEAD